MKLNCIRHRTSAFAAGVLAAAVGVSASATPPTISPLNRISLRGDAAQIEVFVQLDTPSVAELNISTMQATGALASSEIQRNQAAQVDAQQSVFRQYLASVGATELGALRVGANGLRLRINADQLDTLKSLPGVRTVGRVQLQHLTNITSVPWIGAPAVWNTLHAKGEHIKIGIIDTGIDYTHANFGGSGNPADYTKINPDVVTAGTFPTAKVRGGIDFAGHTYDARDPASVPKPDANPLDVVGHGSHVAGTAAGFGVAGKIGPGVAPAADLYAIKVFGDLGGSTNLTSQGIEWALDPNGDGDMSDHMDVINMSLGSDFAEPNDPSAISSQHASDLGIVVVASSGNAGAVPYVTGAPADAPNAISVAASIPGGRVYSRVTVTAPASVAGTKNNLEGAGPVQLKDIGPVSGALINSVPTNGCTPFTNASDVAGGIAFVMRGTCTFDAKYVNAQAAGARAIVVYNDGATAARVDPLVMATTTPTIAIPGVMISSTDGFPLAAAATTAASPVKVTLDVGPDPTKDDQITSFSSRGPGPGGTHFKPEISAPGFSIVSTAVGTGTEGVSFQGTSMAAPHVTGSAALLRQLHPKFGPGAIKALLLNSTVNANPSGDTDLARQGVGVVRVDRAAALTSYASPGGVSFGRLNPVVPIVRSRSVKLTDFGGHSRFFTVKSVPHKTYPGVQVSCPSSVTVRPNRSNEFDINLSFDPRVALTKGVSDNWFISETEVDGWCVLSDGKDTLRVGYLASVDAASLMISHRTSRNTIALANVGPSVGLAEGFTLVGTGKHSDDGDEDEKDTSTTPAPSNTIAQLGVRHNTVGGNDTFQFGIALNHIFQNLSAAKFTLLLDTNNDGVDDVELDGADISTFDPNQPVGTFVTAQFDLKTGNGFLDWPGIWDFNDRVATLTYTTAANTGTQGTGLVPPKFSYHLTLVNSDGSTDVIHGTVDMSKEVVPDLNDFTLNPGEVANVGFSRVGTTLWLYPGNSPRSQVNVVTVGKKED
ncbi:MAG: putative in family peptidase [Gammaproteobacteria bacterium]|nr:putative in family peptidase [Gammaproteobacteria bacterium]